MSYYMLWRPASGDRNFLMLFGDAVVWPRAARMYELWEPDAILYGDF